MEKEPKKSAAESTSRQAETSDREPEAGSSPCESPEPHPGILREIGKEAREQVRPNQGYLKIDYFTLFWLFVAGSVFGLVVETAFHAIVYGGYESRAGLVWGPFSPIYGVGAVALTVSLNRFYHSHNLIIFLIAMLLGSVMEYAKHPLVGDPAYTSGAPSAPAADLGLDRQFLHSFQLSFQHPVTGESLRFADNLPADLQEALDDLASRSTGRTTAGEEVRALLEDAPRPRL